MMMMLILVEEDDDENYFYKTQALFLENINIINIIISIKYLLSLLFEETVIIISNKNFANHFHFMARRCIMIMSSA
jgi:hypothetical protein